jgi:hypothetical protein
MYWCHTAVTVSAVTVPAATVPSLTAVAVSTYAIVQLANTRSLKSRILTSRNDPRSWVLQDSGLTLPSAAPTATTLPLMRLKAREEQMPWRYLPSAAAPVASNWRIGIQ